MPAGPRILYFGFGLTARQVFAFLDPKPYIVKEDDDEYLSCDYLDAFESLLANKGYQYVVSNYGNGPSLDPNNLDKTVYVYGHEIARFEIFEPCEFNGVEGDDGDDVDLNNFKAEFPLSQKPKYYCIYTGD